MPCFLCLLLSPVNLPRKILCSPPLYPRLPGVVICSLLPLHCILLLMDYMSHDRLQLLCPDVFSLLLLRQAHRAHALQLLMVSNKRGIPQPTIYCLVVVVVNVENLLQQPAKNSATEGLGPVHTVMVRYAANKVCCFNSLFCCLKHHNTPKMCLYHFWQRTHTLISASIYKVR